MSKIFLDHIQLNEAKNPAVGNALYNFVTGLGIGIGCLENS